MSWSKALLFGNLLCLCGIGSYWLSGSPLEAVERGRPTVMVTGTLGERGSERVYSVGSRTKQNSVGSGDVLTSHLETDVSAYHRSGPSREVACEDSDGSCKGTSAAATGKLNKKTSKPRTVHRQGQSECIYI